MDKQGRHYHFNGNTEEIVNAILSLLLGKEHYQEVSFYSSFLGESHSQRYKKRLRIILELMQNENLILIRENTEDSIYNFNGGAEIKNPVVPNGYSPGARVYLRQHGKEVLTNGGYKRQAHKRIKDASVLK